MDPTAAPPPHATMLVDILSQFGSGAPMLIAAAIGLSVLSLVLFFKIKPVTHNYALIAFSLWPLLLGIFFTTWNCIGELKSCGDRGISNSDYALNGSFGAVLTPLLLGSFLTCLFLPIGIGLLVNRRSK